MRLTAQDDYGLRCLLHLARAGPGGSVTIAQIADRESLSTANVARLMRRLLQAGLVNSVRGQKGGYCLTQRAEDVRLSDVLEAMGESLYSPCVCDRYSGLETECVHTADCAIRAVWSSLDQWIQVFLSFRTLSDLQCTERGMTRRIKRDLRDMVKVAKPER
jgi:Rrf2 family protein